MQTNSTAIQQKIEELEEWLKTNSPEHESRPQIEADLRNLKLQQADGRD